MTSLTVAEPTTLHANRTSFTSPNVTVTLNRLNVSTTISLNLFDFFSVTTNYANCGPYKVSAFTTNTFVTVATSTYNTWMTTEPTYEVKATGLMTPLLSVKYGASAPDIPAVAYLTWYNDVIGGATSVTK